MRIGINADGLTSTTPCGVNTYLKNILPMFCQLDCKNEFLLFAQDVVHLESHLKQEIGRKWGSFSRIGFSRLFNKNRCDVAFMPKESVPIFINKPTVITVYDIFLLKMYKQFRGQIKFSAKIHYELARLRDFKKATKLCAISESCKQDLIEFCNISPKKIEVIHLAYDAGCFFPRSDEEILEVKQKHGVTQPYFINISSGFWDRKNLMGLLESFKMIQEAGFPHQLIIAGGMGPSYQKMQKYVDQYNLNVKFLISVPVKELASLLSGAKALVFPSFDEGFGLPIIEAMACNCPVITSNTSAMPEVAGGAALLVDPYQCEDIYAAMKRVIEDMPLVNQLKIRGLSRAKDFSWVATARQTLDVIYSVG